MLLFPCGKKITKNMFVQKVFQYEFRNIFETFLIQKFF